MTGALLYLTRSTIRNRLLFQARRLRSPRYALALILGVGYFWLILLRPAVQPGRAPRIVWTSAEIVAALGILLLMLGAWVFKGERMALAFTPAEVQFLFTGPVTRRGLLSYKLFRAQLVIFLNAVIWVFLLRRSGSVLAAPLRLLGTWMLFTNLSLHRLGAALVRTSLVEHGRAGLRRQAPAIVFGSLAAVAVLLILRDAVPSIRAAQSGQALAQAIEGAASSTPAMLLLFVPRVIVGPSFAQTGGEWLRAVWPAALLLLLQLLWVIRSDVAFEEAAAQASLERARRVEAMRRRARGGPGVRAPGRVKRTLPLAPTGAPDIAIVWKNTLLLMRTGRIGAIVGLAIMAVVLSLPAMQSGGFDRQFVAVAALAMAGLLIILGSRVLQNDLRHDTDRVAALKVLPLSGARLVAAEIFSSTLPIVCLQLVLVVAAYLALVGDSTFPVSPSIRTSAALLSPILLFALNMTTVTIQNGAALLFPGWVRVSPVVGGGVEAMGQGILATGMLLLTFVVALLPAIIAFVAVTFAVRGVVASGWIVALLAASAVLLGETWLAIRGLGKRFERMEPAERSLT